MATTALSFFLVVLICVSGPVSAQTPTPTKEGGEFVKGKICIGTNDRMSVPTTRENHYRNLLERYSNCTYVDGNLELTWLENENLDLSFLQFIREVTGHVLISHVNVKRIVLPKLQIIRGRTLFKVSVQDEDFALMVTMSKMHSLELPSLRDILAGSVGIYNNYNLCHIKTINWDEIITGPGARYLYMYNFTESERECSPCNESCEAGCWGEGPENCQKFSKINCSPQCYQGRCFGPNPRECCHLFCAGGCKGPKQSDCLACRNFYDDGVCKQECPAMQKYNPTSYSWETNPEGKYAYGATCVKTCPEHLLKDNGACVRVCPQKKKAVNGECVPCDGPCPKTCEGVTQLNSENINNFKDCTIIEGSLTILDTTFEGYLHIHSDFSFGPRYPKMHPDRLEVFSTLKEITGHLDIQGDHPDFKNLSYFRNLEVIGGRTNAEYSSALYIVKTSLESLNLRSLRKISSGAVSILENKNLCYADSINWTRIVRSYQHSILIRSNQDPEICKAQGMVCSDQCSAEGCWGPKSDECLSCARYKLVDHCVQSCNQTPGIYEATPGICKHCHHQCNGTCVGPGPGNCTHCRAVRDGPFCVAECPVTKYDSGGECLPCHENCVEGCKGPKNTIGPMGCNSCEKAVIDGDVVVRCMKKDDLCPDGYYHEYMGPQEQGNLKSLAGKPICRRCHPRCKRCIAFGFHVQVCQECARYKRGEQCEDECPREHYADEESQECLPCHSECRECHGPLSSQCTSCRNYRIYQDGGEKDDSGPFNCTASCPVEFPYKIFTEDERSDPYCAKEPDVGRMVLGEEEQVPAIIGGVLGCVFLLGAFLVLFGYHWRQRARAKENTVKMTMVMSGYEDSEPLRPTNVKPNLAKLRIVKEAELRRGGILGYGAFGTVYKGVWIPEGENVKIPVAIKVLREGTGANTSKEFLEEAYIMASVEHPNLLQLLAVCMTSQMMLVTQLMPLGCLLDYVRNNRDKIGSKPLLNWCTQIARGMSYLEERRLVHRDLAARNVLVQTPSCIKITDFGLAKLLDINEDEYKAAGGKMPIKWLALECIQHRIFTHKSDVWAFGVTVWELLTYGGRPYESISARDVPELLEKGERLPQPPICTIDVYMIMIKCWMLDAESRPSFRELADEFAKMARDPGRYLVIPGDKFMRLPSYTPQDEKELIRNLSSAMDGPGVIMDAEEYLQPRGANEPSAPTLQVISTTTSSGSPPRTPNKDIGIGGGGLAGMGVGGGFTSSSAESPQNAHNWNRERRYAHLEAGRGTPTGSTHTHDSSSRYCSDPLKLVGRDTSDESFDRMAAQKREAMVGGMKLDLPLDDDDYLMPSPQVPSNSAAYMDLIGDSKGSDMGDMRNGGTFGSYPDFLPLNTNRSMTILDNPEYHMMNQGQQQPQQHQQPQHQGGATPSIPIASSQQPQGMFRNLHHLSPHQQQHQNPPPQRSSEEESDHEYYNDLDRLQRELQPLKGGVGLGLGVGGGGVGGMVGGGRRSETTV